MSADRSVVAGPARPVALPPGDATNQEHAEAGYKPKQANRRREGVCMQCHAADMVNLRDLCETCQRKVYHRAEKAQLKERKTNRNTPRPSALDAALLRIESADLAALHRLDLEKPMSLQKLRRKCLGCDEEFKSQHRGNRMCGRCQDLSARVTKNMESAL